MNNIAKTIEVSSLFELYKNLLTDKQCEYFELYYNEDLSFQEIAQEIGVSRAAVHDSISKTIEMLYKFEEKLSLQNKQNKIQKIIDEFKNSNNLDIKRIVEKLEAI